jgi:xylulokinase
MENACILLDVGSTSIKTALVKTGSTSLQYLSSINTPDLIKPDLYCRELSPNHLLQACLTMLKKLATLEYKYTGLLITGQMGGWVLTDLENRTKSNIVSWQDYRSLIPNLQSTSSYNLFESLYKSDLMAKNGREFRSGLPIVGMHADLKNLSSFDGDLRFHSIISWIGSQLCVDYRFISHSTDAAASGFLDIGSNAWIPISREILPLRLDLPDVVNEVTPIGFSEILHCPVYTPVGDQQSSLYGIKLSSKQIAINLGTGAQISMLNDGLSNNEIQSRPYFQGEFIATKTHLPGGRAITAFLKMIVGNDPTDTDFSWMNNQIDQFAHYSPVDVENFESEILFHKDMLKENRGKFASDVLHSITTKYLDVIQKFEPTSDYEVLVAGGVGTKMDNIARKVADSLNLKIKYASTEETTLQGLVNIREILN